jgi:hypothetical protein
MKRAAYLSKAALFATNCYVGFHPTRITGSDCLTLSVSTTCIVKRFSIPIFFAEDQAIIEDWLKEFNAIQPHESLGNLPPYQFAPEQP